MSKGDAPGGGRQTKGGRVGGSKTPSATFLDLVGAGSETQITGQGVGGLEHVGLRSRGSGY